MNTINKWLQIWSIINTTILVLFLCAASLALFFVYQKYQNSYKYKQDLLSTQMTIDQKDLVLEKYEDLNNSVLEVESLLLNKDFSVEKIHELNNSSVNIKNINVFEGGDYVDVILDVSADEKSIEFFLKDLRDYFKRILITAISIDLTSEAIGGIIQLRILK